MFLWRQEDTSSLRLFSVDSSGRQMIRNFSLRQRLHLLLELLYGECDERMRQEIKCSMLLSLRVQICLLSSVEFLCLAWRNDAVWFLYLVLKSFSVSPMYVSVVLLSLRVKNTSTNIGHKFLALVDKHFPKDHKLRKIFNRNTIKISYSCMNNTKQIIDNHNKRILTAPIQIDDTAAAAAAAAIDNNKTCNCRQKNTCPLDGNCLQSSVIYQATVTRKDNNTTETYIGLTENDFKTRYRNHTASFRHAKHRNSTELSKHIWTLKNNNIEHFISWRILSSHSPYNSSSKRCNLCLKEKFLIICRPELSTLNKRNELVSSCRHRNKALLRNN